MCKDLCLYLLILLQCCSAGPEVRVAGVAIIRTAVCITPALQRCILELETNLRMFHKHRKVPNLGLLKVESGYKFFYI